MKKSFINKSKLIITFILIFFSSFYVKAQEKSKWSIGFSAMPEYCFRILDNSKYAKANNNKINLDRYKYGYTVGLLVKYDFTERISLQSGSYLADYGYRTKDHVDKIAYSFSKYPPYTVYYNNVDNYSIFHFHSINFPFLFKYKMINKKHFYWDLGLGFALNVFYYEKEINYIKNSSTGDWEKNTNNDTYSAPHPNFFGKINTTLGYKLKRISINLDLDYSLSAFDDSDGRYYYGFGTGIEMIFNLNKKIKK